MKSYLIISEKETTISLDLDREEFHQIQWCVEKLQMTLDDEYLVKELNKIWEKLEKLR